MRQGAETIDFGIFALSKIFFWICGAKELYIVDIVGFSQEHVTCYPP